MSHQSNIQPDDKLREFISKSKNSTKCRLVKIAIKDEQLVLDGQDEPRGKWEDDYDKLVKSQLLDKQPSYVLFRMDSKNSSAMYDWLLLLWSPEGSPVREKMLYASTKATLKVCHTQTTSANWVRLIDIPQQHFSLRRKSSVRPRSLTTSWPLRTTRQAWWPRKLTSSGKRPKRTGSTTRTC